MNYGSRNTEEESEFIRRVVAPPKRNGGARRKQKRMAAVGGAVALLAVGATVAYVAMPNDASHAVSTETLATESVAEFVIPDEDEAAEEAATIAIAESISAGTADSGVAESGSKLPRFSDYDLDSDGVLSHQDFQTRLGMNRDDAIARVSATDYLSAEEKDVMIATIKKNYDTEFRCVVDLAENVRLASPVCLLCCLARLVLCD